MDWDLVSQVQEVLYQHRAKPTGSPFCACGWQPALMLNDTGSDIGQHLGHQAEMVVTHTLIGGMNHPGIQAEQ